MCPAAPTFCRETRSNKAESLEKRTAGVEMRLCCCNLRVRLLKSICMIGKREREKNEKRYIFFSASFEIHIRSFVHSIGS